MFQTQKIAWIFTTDENFVNDVSCKFSVTTENITDTYWLIILQNSIKSETTVSNIEETMPMAIAIQTLLQSTMRLISGTNDARAYR